MRGLIRLLFFIPRLVCRMIGRLIWGLIKTVLVLGIIVFSLLYYANHSESQFANLINTVANQVSQTFSANTGQSVLENITNLSTDNLTGTTNARWETNAATVYIASTDATLIRAYQEAIDSWNETGVFTFTLVSDQDSADIIATDYSDQQSEAAGLAETQTNLLTNRITHVDVLLNTYYLTENDYGYTMERITNTAIHELGHAIGLDHKDSETSVMASSGSYYGIQETDIAEVKALYSDLF